eukprot:SAG31_NODE_483_length_15042_cov_28.867764_7_plen_64_part_00
MLGLTVPTTVACAVARWIFVALNSCLAFDRGAVLAAGRFRFAGCARGCARGCSCGFSASLLGS